MRTHLGKFLLGIAVAAFALLGGRSRALAIDTMADWIGQNTVSVNPPIGGTNDYGIISDTSAGGQFQSQNNYTALPNQEEFIYLSDRTFAAPSTPMLSFTQELHMKGTLTFTAPTDFGHIWFFGWYASANTRNRIGLSVLATTPSENNFLKFTGFYAATGTATVGQSPTADGTTNLLEHNGDLPNGTYPFTFDYVPGPTGTMKATVGNYFMDMGPVPAAAANLSALPLDRFGFMQRHTGVTDPSINFNMVMSDITYTGGSAIGDANGDRIVNIFDINLVSAHWDEVGPEGDVNGDFAVNIFDINLISAYWSPTTPPGATTAVPEPSSVVLAGLSLMGMSLIAIRKRRRSGKKNWRHCH